MNQFSFPTVTVDGLGPCVSRKILIERGGITGNDIYKCQPSLTDGTDWTRAQLNGSNSQNYYALGGVLKIAQMLPTEELQAIAQEIRSTLYPVQQTTPQALPAYESPDGLVHVQGQGHTHQRDYVGDTTPMWRGAFANSQNSQLTQDPRVNQLAQTIAQQIQPTQSQQGQNLTQQQFLDGITQLQSSAVSHVQTGFNMALTAQNATGETISNARPNVTNNADNRAYSTSVYDYANNAVNGMNRLQFGILCSALFCVGMVGLYSILSFNDSNDRQTRYAPSSINYRGN